jgi:hypothetical protein
MWGHDTPAGLLQWNLMLTCTGKAGVHHSVSTKAGSCQPRHKSDRQPQKGSKSELCNSKGFHCLQAVAASEEERVRI